MTFYRLQIHDTKTGKTETHDIAPEDFDAVLSCYEVPNRVRDSFYFCEDTRGVQGWLSDTKVISMSKIIDGKKPKVFDVFKKKPYTTIAGSIWLHDIFD